jgi:hypothetical protein
MTPMMTTAVAWGLRVVHAKVPKTTLLPSSRFKPPRRLLAVDPYTYVKLHRLQSHKSRRRRQHSWYDSLTLDAGPLSSSEYD